MQNCQKSKWSLSFNQFHFQHPGFLSDARWPIHFHVFFGDLIIWFVFRLYHKFIDDGYGAECETPKKHEDISLIGQIFEQERYQKNSDSCPNPVSHNRVSYLLRLQCFSYPDPHNRSEGHREQEEVYYQHDEDECLREDGVGRVEEVPGCDSEKWKGNAVGTEESHCFSSIPVDVAGGEGGEGEVDEH